MHLGCPAWVIREAIPPGPTRDILNKDTLPRLGDIKYPPNTKKQT